MSWSVVSEGVAGHPSCLRSSDVIPSFSLAAPRFSLVSGPGRHGFGLSFVFLFQYVSLPVFLSLVDFDLAPACPRAFLPGSPYSSAWLSSPVWHSGHTYVSLCDTVSAGGCSALFPVSVLGLG